ncbi:hypothetical protein ABPG74_015863 [Tetrahymena malaccensis]
MSHSKEIFDNHVQNQDLSEQDCKKKPKKLFDLDRVLSKLIKCVIPQQLNQKTQFCKHDCGCSEEIIKQTLKSFLLGYSVIGAVDIIALILKSKMLKKNPFILFVTLVSSKNIRFASFPALYTLVMKSLMCILRRIFKDDNGKMWFISGFVGGFLSLLTKEKNNRSMWSLFLLTRAFETFYRYHIIQKTIPKFQLDYVLVYCLMIGFTVSIYFTEPSCNSRGLHKAWENFSCEHSGDYGIRKIYMGIMNKKLQIDGISTDEPDKFINWNRKF